MKKEFISVWDTIKNNQQVVAELVNYLQVKLRGLVRGISPLFRPKLISLGDGTSVPELRYL